MVASMENPVAANILGTAGAVCWSIQLLPQIVKNWRRHSTEGLHPVMYLSWAVAGIPLGTYNLVQGLNVALQVQPQILILLSLVAWAQCKHYGDYSGAAPGDKWGTARVVAGSTAAALAIGGAEAGLFFALRLARRRGTEWPLTLTAVLAAVLLAVGVLRYYVEIYRSRSVVGISFAFVAIDAGGDLVSVLALLCAPRLDVLGVAVYATELVLWMGVGALGVHYRLRAWLVRRFGRQQQQRPEGEARPEEDGSGPEMEAAAQSEVK